MATVASNSLKIAFGPNAGEKVRRIGKGFGYEEEEGVIRGRRTSSINGFTLHADRYIGMGERKKLGM